MQLCQLSEAGVRCALAGPGIAWRVGPFAARLRSPIAALAPIVRELYGEHMILADSTAVDLDMALEPSGGVRRIWRRQVRFLSDGETPFHPLPLDQAPVFLEWGMNWGIATHAHDMLVVHAAVVAMGGRALLLPAPSGAGKSTLAAALALDGWRLLSDELALISRASGALLPLARPVNLKNASIDLIAGRFPAARLIGLVDGTSKGKVGLMVPPPSSVAAVHEPARPSWIVLPRYVQGASGTLSPLGRAKALMQLADNAMNYSILGREGFELLCGTVESCRCFSLVYGRLDDALRILRDMSEEAACP